MKQLYKAFLHTFNHGYFIVQPPPKSNNKAKKGKGNATEPPVKPPPPPKVNITNDNFFRALDTLNEETDNIYIDGTPVADHIRKAYQNNLRLDCSVLGCKPSDKEIATWTYIAGAHRILQIRRQIADTERETSAANRLLGGGRDFWAVDADEPYQCLGFRFEDWYRALTVLRCWAVQLSKKPSDAKKNTSKQRASPNTEVYPPQYFTRRERKQFKRHQKLVPNKDNDDDAVDGLGDYIVYSMPARARFDQVLTHGYLGHDDSKTWAGGNVDTIGKSLMEDLTKADDPNALERPPFETKRQLSHYLGKIAWRSIVLWGPADIDKMRTNLEHKLSDAKVLSGISAGKVKVTKPESASKDKAPAKDDADTDDEEGKGLTQTIIDIRQVSSSMPSFKVACETLSIDMNTRKMPLCGASFKPHQPPGNATSSLNLDVAYREFTSIHLCSTA